MERGFDAVGSVNAKLPDPRESYEIRRSQPRGGFQVEGARLPTLTRQPDLRIEVGSHSHKLRKLLINFLMLQENQTALREIA